MINYKLKEQSQQMVNTGLTQIQYQTMVVFLQIIDLLNQVMGFQIKKRKIIRFRDIALVRMVIINKELLKVNHQIQKLV